MKFLLEATEFFKQNPEDEYDIVKVSPDDGHSYKYCDGIKYELRGGEKVVEVSEIEFTPENTFYNDQIDRYVEYIRNGGILESFPVDEVSIGGATNLEEMCEYLSESDNFDLLYDLLEKYYSELFNIIEDLPYDHLEYGIDDNVLSSISNISDLDKHYGDDYDEKHKDDDDLYWKEEYYLGFKTILEYWNDNKEYVLTDMNHRFAAVKKIGKKRVFVDPN